MMRKKVKVGFVSLGCSKNRLDTEIMLSHLVEAGYQITPDETEADVVIVNTCAFINDAKKEAIDNILDVAWLKTNAKLKAIIVTGCLSERYREEIFEELPEVDALLGVGSIHNIVEAVEAVLDKKRQTKYSCFDDKDKLELGGDRVVTTPEYTSYIKISEGCDNRCSYCAIPNIRGRFRSRKIEDIVEEAKTLEALGVKELNIIAQDTTRYGSDITKNTDIPWIRLLYCYPDKITDELIEEIKTNDRILKYIDLPIQHIDADVLKKMRRHGGPDIIKSAIKRLRENIPGIVIRTTVIVGFPGESEKAFSDLCSYVKETEFDHIGAFTYSREEGTPAYDFEDQIDEQTKQDRYDILMKETLESAAKRTESMISKEFTVLCEGYDGVSEAYFGRSYMDAPEIDGKIFFTSKRKLSEGEFVKVRITDSLDYDLVGEVC